MESAVEFGALNYAILIGYLMLMFGIGLAFAGRQKSTEDYFLAGRNMPWLVVAMSMFASVTSASSYIGLPGSAYSENSSLLMVGFASVLAAPVLVCLFFPFYRRLNVTTSYEYIGQRFGRSARFTTSGLFVLARLGWLGVVIYSPSLVISEVAGLNLYLAIVLMGILAVSYTSLGGLSAVLWTDVLQFIVLVGGAVWVAVTLIVNVPNGFSGIIQTAQQNDHLMNWDVSLFEMSATVVLASYFVSLIQEYGTDQISVQRLMAVKTYRGMVGAALLNSFFDLLIVTLLLFLGIGMFAYYTHFQDLLATGVEGDRVLPFYIVHALPNGISGLLITALFAAAMSSMDSGINSLATVIVTDFIKPLRRKPSIPRNDIRLARYLTFSLGALAIGVACYASTIGQVLKASQIFLGLFSGPVLALFMLGVLSRRANFRGWCVGTVPAIVATIYVQRIGIHWTYYFPFCFAVSFVVGYLASALISDPHGRTELTIWGEPGSREVES
jgi:SSS family transporter